MAQFPHYRTVDFNVEKHVKSDVDNSLRTKEISDIQLWEEFKMGDELALSKIYKNNADKLYGYGLKLVGGKEVVKDAIQDLFVELWNSKERLGEVRSIKSYLYSSIRRKLLAKVVKERKLYSSEEMAESICGQVPSAEISLIEKQRFEEDRQELRRALAKLNDKQREIIHLKFYAHLSYDEISEIMSMDRKAIYNLMAYTIKFLKNHLSTFLAIMVACS
ncbi:sigma-70 family RNA polymerase sigma factor [Maribacter sp. MMG018]|uniref:RNA polymerase sigma factor n=1 Tax=Maribacter sp. MMG018 TaxID=2822688 RepID=UPI001B38A0CF|nr:sigma-70 family RNA polymerase sigma factor [Maribacter sp. MMG018]MBQ4913788.1 sigma-70 family RNA polymerase sigma factor [Maribacter sp. MMG018]